MAKFEEDLQRPHKIVARMDLVTGNVQEELASRPYHEVVERSESLDTLSIFPINLAYCKALFPIMQYAPRNASKAMYHRASCAERCSCSHRDRTVK